MLAVLIVDRPERCAIGFGKGERVKGFTTEEPEAAFFDLRWQIPDGFAAPKEKQQPVALPFIGFFGNHAEKVQITCGDFKAGFFLGFSYGTFKGRLADTCFDLAADGAPIAGVWHLCAQD